MTVNYCSSPCGAGKTHEIGNRSCDLVESFKKVLILQSTRELIDTTVQEELLSRPKFPAVRIFHRGTVGGGKVAKALADHVREVPDEIQEIVFATHQVLPYIKHFANKHKWHVFIDEDLQAVRYKQHQIPRTHYLITDKVNVRQVDHIYGRVTVNDHALHDIARNEDHDELLETLAETCRILENEYWETFVNIEQYERLRRGEGKLLAFHSVLKPEILDGFASVFMASANFEDSAIFKLWSLMGVEFEPDPDFPRGLRYSEHPNGEYVTIYYATEHQWSRKRREKILSDGTTIPDRMVQAAKELFSTGRFLWHANKSMTHDPFGTPAERLPNKPHGLNKFVSFDDIVFLSSLNPTTDHFRFLETRGLDGYDVRGCTYFAAAYQAIMRTSIRDHNSRSPKRILVPDISLAEYLNDIFPGSKIEKLSIGLIEEVFIKSGRPRKHQSNRERVAGQRQRARGEKLRILAEQLGLNSPDTDEENWEIKGARCRAEKGIRLYTSFGTQPLTATQPLTPRFSHRSFPQSLGSMYPAKSMILLISCANVIFDR